MKEQTLVQMKNNIGVLLQATSRLAQEIDFLKTMMFGHDTILKKLDEYEAIIEELKAEAESITVEAKEEGLDNFDNTQ